MVKDCYEKDEPLVKSKEWPKCTLLTSDVCKRGALVNVASIVLDVLTYGTNERRGTCLSRSVM